MSETRLEFWSRQTLKETASKILCEWAEDSKEKDRRIAELESRCKEWEQRAQVIGGKYWDKVNECKELQQQYARKGINGVYDENGITR
jgi:hypothetical protein